MSTLFILTALLTLGFLRLYCILPSRTPEIGRKREHGAISPRSLAVYLGSGGHTTEALKMISALNFSQYYPRIYYISDGDSISAEKALALENKKAQVELIDSGTKSPRYKIIQIPRARRVHQSFFSTIPTAIYSLLACVYEFAVPAFYRGSTVMSPDILLLNGPGTCFILCLAIYVNKFFGVRAPVMVYIESFARVKTLSLSGKLLGPLVDRFIVQWPELQKEVKHAEYYGWLV